MKLCNICFNTKPSTEFHRNKAKSDGLQNRCKACDAIHHKSRRESDIEFYQGKINQYRRKWNVNDGIGVYGLWNKIEECWDYVGEGALNDRESGHRNACNTSTPWEVKLNIWLDGWDNVYEFRVLWRCDSKQQCQDTETEYITQLNPRYNDRKNKHKRQYEAE